MLIIDSNNLGYKSFFTMGGLKSGERDTGVVFGFMNQVLSLSSKFKTDRFVFCWDSRKRYRKIIYKGYKEKRQQLVKEEKKEREIVYRQFDQLREIVLPALGFNNIFQQTGYESDDLIAEVVSRNPKDDKVIISTDNDLYQLLNKDVRIYSDKKIITENIFKKEFGILPCEWVFAKCIGGCDSDEVKGIKGVADPAKSKNSLALKYIKGELKRGKVFERIESEEGIEKRRFNALLIRLPFEGRKKINVKLKKDRLSKKKFIKVFGDLDFQSFLKKDKLKRWCDNFKCI